MLIDAKPLNYDKVIAFLEKECTDAAAVYRFKQAYHSFFKTGEWHIPYNVSVAGWQNLDGVMLMSPVDVSSAQDSASEYYVSLTATTERALRELLLTFPRQYTGLFHVQAKWMYNALTEVLEGTIVNIHTTSFERTAELVEKQDKAQPKRKQVYRGIKRGALTGSPRLEKRVVSKRKDAITSQFRKLTSLKGKLEHSGFIVEERMLVKRAIDDGLPIDTVLYTPKLVKHGAGAALLKQAHTEHLPYYQVSDGVMGSVTTTRPVPSVVASVQLTYRNALSKFGGLNFHFSPGCTLLITENIGNPDNLGMTLRTADAAGVSAVLLSGEGASPFHKNCIRAARGAVGRLPLFYTKDLQTVLETLHKAGGFLLGATASAEQELYSTTFNLPAAVIVGNENVGLSAETREQCPNLVRIPMAAGQSSLNVGVAAGVLLYELVRHKQSQSVAKPLSLEGELKNDSY